MKKLEDYKWLCVEPFANIHVHSSGKMKPCCAMNYHDRMLKFPEMTEIDISKDSFWDYYYHPSVKRLRDAMRNGNDDEYVDAVCWRCKDQEQSKNRSQREFLNNRYNNEFSHKKEEIERIIAEDAHPTFFHSFEFKPLVSNLCNLSCNMCGPTESTKYHSEMIKLGEAEKGKLLVSSDICDKAWEEMPDILSRLEEIKLVGGEPLMAKGTYRMMEMVPEPETKRLKVITNGTIDPTKFIELAKNYREADVNISIEGIPSIQEYIRYPSKWDEILKHYHMIKKVARTRFVSTINALNISTSPELLKFMEDNHFLFSQTNAVVNNCYSLRSIPPDIRDMYLNKLYKNKMTTMIRYLEDTKYNEAEMWQLMSHVKRRDNHRGKNLLELLPEWKPYYDKVIV
jgi:organic radical activating enzyme